MQATPATWRLLVDSGWTGTPGLKVLCGGEALPRALADELLARSAEVWNVYGPTETTVWSTVDRVLPDEGAVPIGRPIANTQTWVLDPSLQPVPLGVPGELYIGGAGVARGYHRRPALTAERFVPDPFSVEPGARLYATGDLARWRSDGRLECLGRRDHQVKLRGFRIEPGEIEATLARHPAVRQAVVVVRGSGTHDARLVAYVVADGSPSSAELRAHLAEDLPAYMVPAAFVLLDSLPLTPNGKIDRRALPAPDAADTPDAARPVVAPRTPVERTISGIWAEALGSPPRGVHDGFFESGGHSLAAALVISRIRAAFGVGIALRSLFEHPTVAGLAEVVTMLELTKAPVRDGEPREEFEL
jgi:acyl-CoA synthetase (AMP-forming)/AMP-acid ligase II